MMHMLIYVCLLLPAGSAPDWGLAVFVENFGGPGVYTGRWPFDYDEDQDVDLRDFAVLQNQWTGEAPTTTTRKAE